MSSRYNESFKRQAVEKALSRSEGATLAEVSDLLGIGHSTLQKWIVKFGRQQPGSDLDRDNTSIGGVKKEKRPQDWSPEERLDMVIVCGSLEAAAMNQLCRERGLYAHHVTQWRQDFISGSKVPARSDAKGLKDEVRELKKELNRKDRALAETAALLVLQKKVRAIWGNDEDNLR